MAIINGRGRVGIRPTSGSGSSYDTDALAFFTAASITDSTQMGAVNTLVTGLKSAGLWTKIRALYPIVGGNATAHSKNLKDINQYNLTFSNGWVHSSNGMLPNYSYASTGLAPSTFSSNTDLHLAFYSRTNNSTAGYEMGADYGYSGYRFDLIAKYSTLNNMYSLFETVSLAPNNDSRGFYMGLSVASGVKVVKNGTVLNTTQGTRTNLSLLTQDVYIGAEHRVNGPADYSTKQCAFASIGYGMSDAEIATYNTLVQAFQTTLGRQV
jgi:hypothetical protein